MSVSLHIDRLVLDGIELSGRERIDLKRAVRSEIARSVRDNGLSDELRGMGARPSLRTADIQLRTETSAGRLGVLLSRSVYRSIGK